MSEKYTTFAAVIGFAAAFKNETHQLGQRSGADGIKRCKVTIKFLKTRLLYKELRIFMKNAEFERIISQERMRRYLLSCGGNTRKAMTLYRYNLQLSQEVFTIISCFEVALRNAIDDRLKSRLGSDWLRDSILPHGVFTLPKLVKTANNISYSYNKLMANGIYSHTKLLSDMEFGTWKYMFSPLQFRLTGRCLLGIFPNKPTSSATMQYNHTYIFNELDKVNTLRNRIAHHEPICFRKNSNTIDTSYIVNEYQKIQTLFLWMGIDSHAMLYGLDHVLRVASDINALK